MTAEELKASELLPCCCYVARKDGELHSSNCPKAYVNRVAQALLEAEKAGMEKAADISRRMGNSLIGPWTHLEVSEFRQRNIACKEIAAAIRSQAAGESNG